MPVEHLSLLKILWDFISPILGDTLKERIILSSSEDKAKKKAFRLYQNLEKLQFTTDEFVLTFDQFVKCLNENKEVDALLQTRENLRGSMLELSDNLQELRYILEGMNLPMKIHLPTLLQKLNEYKQLRGDAMEAIDRLIKLDKLTIKDIGELSIVLAAAKTNRTIIITALDNFRNFLKDEFSFKDSF